MVNMANVIVVIFTLLFFCSENLQHSCSLEFIFCTHKDS